MCKSAIINNQYVEMVADNYQGYRRGPHTHATGSLSFCINLTYRTAEVHIHLSTLVWCVQKPKIWSSYKNCLSKGKKNVAGAFSLKSNKMIPKRVITRIYKRTILATNQVYRDSKRKKK